jgi:hypothetical protein
MIKKYIVCTTINSPTEAIEKFDRIPGWELIVIGDLKTPKNYKLKNGLYINPKAQERIDRKLSDLISWNCIQRRNFGFILAYNLGAEIIATVDDDNIPLAGWGQNLLLDEAITSNRFETQDLVFDPLFATEYRHLWHRGFPIELLNERKIKKTAKKKLSFQIQADFWNGDPDVDAICRIGHNPNCKFAENSFPISSPQLSPFNSQNTFLKRSVFPHYFLFPHIGRMDDIWASYYVEALGFAVVYGKASVFQKRNPHSHVQDLKHEFIGYQNTYSYVQKLKKNPAAALAQFLPKSSLTAFRQYRKHFL